MQQLFEAEGYELVEDAWDEHGRLMFVHDDDADPPHLNRLTRTLQVAGWEKSKTELRTFRHPGQRRYRGGRTGRRRDERPLPPLHVSA